MPARRKRLRFFAAATVIAAALLPARALGSTDSVQFFVVPGPVGYGGPPGAPGVSALGLSGRPESASARLADFIVIDASGSGRGWNITVSGDDRRGNSPVLKQYCREASCGGDPGPGYVSGGVALPPGSLTLDSRGARFVSQSPRGGAPPMHQCEHGCSVDARPASPSKVAEANRGTGMGAFEATGLSSSSVTLVAPSAARSLPAGEDYRVDLSWSLNTGP